MSFEPIEISRQLGEPSELYLFEYGSEYFAYTDSDLAVTFGGRDYVPIPIQRSRAVSSLSANKTQMTVRVPADAALPVLFAPYPPELPVRLKNFRGHANDGAAQYLLQWFGRVLECRFEGVSALLTCEPGSASLSTPGLRRTFAVGCPLPLYGLGTGFCNANKAAATVVRTVVSVSAPQINLSAGWNAHDPAKYLGGMVEWPSASPKYRRTILDSGVDFVRVGGPLPLLAAGDPLNIVLGCDHTLTDCAGLHNNINNYGGQPYMPLKSPVLNSSVF